MTETRADSEVRAFIHGMWANVTTAWRANADDADQRAAAMGLVLDAIAEVTGMIVPPPGAPGPFALSDADRLCHLFADAGFTNLVLDRVSAPLRSPSFDAWWTRNLTIAGPVLVILNGLDEATRTRLQHSPRRGVAV